MASRGFWWYMSARTRKSVVLFWTALFVCSLALQYANFIVAPAPVAAVHDEGLFELDGNTANAGGTAGDDWDSHPGATGNRYLFINDPLDQQTDDIYTGGSTKDDLNTTGWLWTTGSVPDKNNIEHAFAASYVKDGHTFVYFGLDRYANDGDAFTGFWFLKGGVGPVSGGTFSGPHQVGDLLVLANFTNGGATSTVELYEWVGSGGDINGTLHLLGTGQECTGAPVSDKACAITNSSAFTPSWAFDDKGVKDSPNPIPAESFFEGGIDLDELYGGTAPCFGSFIAETRASQSVDAVLKDFAAGAFNTCEPPDIQTQVKQGGQNVSTINVGESVVDVADLTGNNPLPTGTIDFFLCGPNASANPSCTTGGTKVGSTKTLSNGLATSDAFTAASPAAQGYYCFRAVYTPDSAGSNHYVGGSHTNTTTECFQVIPAGIDLTKTADAASVSAGQPIGFTISIKSTGPGTAFGVKVSDTLPTNSGLNWSVDAAGTTGSWTLSSGVLSFGGASGVTMAKDAEYHVHITSPTTAATCGAVNNTGNATTTNDGTDSASASVTVNCPDIKVTKTPDGGDVNAGDTATFSIKVENIGAGSAAGVTVSDNLPAGLHWTESEADCSIAGPDGSQVLSCTVGTLAPGASKTYTVSAVTSKDNCGTITNTASASATNEPSGVLANNSDNGSIDVLCAQIDIEKTANPAGPVSAGDTIGWDIVVSNNGAGTATGVSASDTLPSGVDWTLGGVTGDTTGVSCAITGAVGAEVLTCTDSSMAAGDSFTVHVSGPTDTADCGTINNSATVTTGNDGSDTNGASVVVNCPNVSVLKTADKSPINAGDTAAFTILVSSTGPGTAKGVTLSDALPAGVTWSEDSADCSISGGVLTCSFGDLAADQHRTIHVAGATDAADCTTLNNTATVSATNEPASALGDNSSSAAIVVNCPDLEVVKDGNGPLNAGDTATFSITVTNHGPGAAYDVTLDDQLPTGTWTLGGANAADCSVDGSNLLTCDFGTLADDATRTITLSRASTAVDCGTISNEVTVEASNENTETDQYANTDDADIVVNCPDLRVTKTGNGTISAGDEASFDITIENIGEGKAYGVVLTDNLPDGIDWSENSDQCSIAPDSGTTGQVLTCNVGPLNVEGVFSVTLTGETVAANCGEIPNTASASATNEPRDLLANNQDSDTVVVLCADITITKTADATSVSAGDDIGFTIEVTNTGDGTASGVHVTDTLPTDAGTSWAIDGGTGAADCSIAAGVLTCDFGSLVKGASKTVHISSPTTAATCGSVDNSASVTTSNDGSDGDDASVDVLCAAIDITKTADAAEVVAGDQIGFTVTVRNTGEGIARAVTAQDVLPTGFAWSIQGPANGFSIASGKLVFGPADLAGGASAAVHIVADTTREDCGAVNNTASVTTSNDGSDSASASTSVRCPTIEIDKSNDDADGIVGHGQTVTYTIHVTVGEGPVSNAELTDELPAGQTYVAGSQTANPAATSFAVQPDGSLKWTWASLATEATVTYEVTIDADAPAGDQTNTAEVCVAEVPDCVSDDSTVTVPTLTIEKSFTGNTGGTAPDSTPLAKEGDTLVYTLTYDLTNGPVHHGVITDTLPEGLAYVAGSATNNDEFTFDSFDATTRTLTWKAATVTKDGAVTYQAQVLTGAAELSQPLVNVAAIDSDETDKDTDDAAVGVVPPPLEETATPKITLPPTSTIDGNGQSTSAGSSLMLILLALGGFVLVLGFVTPVPERVRRRNRRG